MIVNLIYRADMQKRNVINTFVKVQKYDNKIDYFLVLVCITSSLHTELEIYKYFTDVHAALDYQDAMNKAIEDGVQEWTE